MKVLKGIKYAIKSKLKLNVIIVLILVNILILPALYEENAQIPASNENLFFLGEINTAQSSSGIQPVEFLLLNHHLNLQANSAVSLNGKISVKTISFINCLPIHLNCTTNNKGVISVNETKLINQAKKIDGTNSAVISFQTCNYSLTNQSLKTGIPAEYQTFYFTSIGIQSSASKNATNESILNGAFLPSYQLGYYGDTPVFYSNELNNSNLSICYKMYNPQNKNANYSITNLTVISKNQLYVDRNYEQIKEFNEASNVSFYMSGRRMIGSMFPGFNGIAIVNPIVFETLNTPSNFVTFPVTEILLLIVIIETLVTYVSMFNYGAIQRYISLPEKRGRVVIFNIVSNFILISLFTVLGMVGSFLYFDLGYRFQISLISMLYVYLLVVAAYLVFVSIYTIVSSYSIGKNWPRLFVTVFLVFAYPILDEIGQSLLIFINFSSFIFNGNDRYLFKPILESIRTYNILSSVLPVLNVESFNNYLIKSPIQGVIMYNHLNIFDLSPLLFLTSIVGISSLLIYLGIRRINLE